MKFLLNLCLSPKIVLSIRSLGHEAIRVDQLNLAKASDHDIFYYAIRNDMIVLTADLDFGQILAFTQKNKPSVIIFRLENPSTEKVTKYLTQVITKFQNELEKGCIIAVNEKQIRVRELPLSE